MLSPKLFTPRIAPARHDDCLLELGTVAKIPPAGRRDGNGRLPLSGDLFVFRNRRGDRLKILAWQGDGYALYLRRLERGTFAFPAADTNIADATALSVTPTELAMILGGIDWSRTQRRRRYQRGA
jgi:transposase